MIERFFAKEIKEKIEGKLLRYFGRETAQATKQQIFRATCLVIRDMMSELWLENQETLKNPKHKQVIYLSMEFLPGTALRNNLFNLELEEAFSEALAGLGQDMSELYEMEPDAGLGNGGLGRLASCYLDAIAAGKMAGHGMSICYEYGIFKQRIKDCEQVEEPDNWLNLGDVWLIEKEDEKQDVHFGGKLEEIWDEKGRMKLRHKDYTTVVAIPKDMLITGYHSDVVNSLRLWQSTSPISIDMALFAQGKYLQAMEEKHRAEVISKILYPEDAHEEGKMLRMNQQYFFISASIQTLVKRHLEVCETLDDFHEQYAIHINDTHPTMAIPELMRILLDEYDYEWDEAWRIVTKTISYTNHTVMPEALEQWPEDLFAHLLPRIHSIVKEINRRQQLDLLKSFPDDAALRKEMAIIQEGNIRMANLCVVAAHTVNGVSSLHSSILTETLFQGFYRLTPEKFTNVTNGIAYRRWLCQANPPLAAFINDLCGPEYKEDANELTELLSYQDDQWVLQRLAEIKRENKVKLAAYIKEHNQITINPDSIFDVQVKRLHEYKRQLLNLIHIISLYHELKENPNADIYPRTFIFAAKAAAGYAMAKQIISLACHLSTVIEKDPAVRDKIKVVFLENYSVSLAEKIIPAAEISEQISLAGKEASGTGNMKLMMNGALTLGTLDGANVEICEAVGKENMFLFGMNAEEVEKMRREGQYNPWQYGQNHKELADVMKLLTDGIDGIHFWDVVNSLTTGFNGSADPYFVLADYLSYQAAQKEAERSYRDTLKWQKMSLINIGKSGIFSADRSVKEYADRIWGLKSIHDKL